MPALELADTLRLPPLHPEQVGRADHVDIEEGPSHEEVRRFGCDVFRQLGQALRGDDPRQPALAPAAHQVGHRRQSHPARVLGHLARGGGGEHLRFVDHHQRRIPMLARGIEQRGEELRGAADLLLDLEPVEIEHHAGAVFADAPRQRLDFARRIGGAVDHHMTELVR